MRMELLLAELGDVAQSELTAWVERGWVRPETGEAGWEFLAIDVARARLIRDLRQRMEVAEDMLPLVLSLLDQVYTLRAQLRDVLAGHQAGHQAGHRAGREGGGTDDRSSMS